MGQVPYNSYHGRRHRGRSVLLGILVALVVVLIAVLAGYYLGLFDLPLPSADDVATPSPAPSAAASQEPVVIVDVPSAPPSPSAAAQIDLSAVAPREELPLGLVPADYADLSAQAPDRDVIVDMTGVELSGTVALPDTQHYVAAWWAVDPGEPDAALADCQSLAALGFDEIVLASTLPEGDGADLAALYRGLSSALEEAGWKGRLGLDVDQEIFDGKYDGDLIPAVAQSFQRLYFRHTLSSANKNALTENGFTATGYTIVTVTKNAASLNYAWAVLP